MTKFVCDLVRNHARGDFVSDFARQGFATCMHMLHVIGGILASMEIPAIHGWKELPSHPPYISSRSFTTNGVFHPWMAGISMDGGLHRWYATHTPIAVLILDVIKKPTPEHPTVIFTVHHSNCIGLCVLYSLRQIESMFGTLQLNAKNDNAEFIQRLGDPSLGPLDGHGPRSSACDKCRSKKVRCLHIICLAAIQL